MFFAKTTLNELRRSIFITVLTLLGFFIPRLIGFGGLFSRSSLGIIAFVSLLYLSISTYYKIKSTTTESIVQVIKLPVKTLSILLAIVIAGWLGLNVLGLNRIGARLTIAIGVSLIEFVSIWYSTFYMGILIYYLIRRTRYSPANE